MFWWLAQNTLLAGALALGAALAGRFGRLSPAVRHALWLLVLVKLVTPPVALYPLPESGPWAAWLAPGGVDETPPIDSFEADSQARQTNAAKMDRPEIGAEESAQEIVELPERSFDDASPIDLGEWEVAAAPNELDVPAEDGPKSLQPSRRSANTGGPIGWPAPTYATLRTVLFGVWAIGAVWMFLLQALRLLRFRRLLQNTSPAPRSLTALVEQIAAQLAVAPPRVVLTSTACSPMVFGFGRPRLIWPTALAEPLEGDALRAVIAHELAHLRRRDHWVGWIELAASCGWWWNPLFWYVRRQLRETAELACDAWVVALLPGGRRAYAQALIDVSELISWTAAPAPAVGMGASARQLFERRLTMILRERVPCRASLVGLALIGVLGIAVLPGWTKEIPKPAADKVPAGAAEEKPELAPTLQAHEKNKFEAKSDPTLRPGAKIDPLADEPALRDKEPRDDPFFDSQAAENQVVEKPGSQPGLPRQASGSEPSADAPDTDLPLGARSIKADRVQHLRQIETLERRMAELADELKALRGQEDADKKEENATRVSSRQPKNTMAPGAWEGLQPDLVLDLPQLRSDEKQVRLAQHQHRPQPALVFDLPREGKLSEVQIRPVENQLIRLRMADKQQLAKSNIEPPKHIRIVAQEGQELVLICMRPGKANATLWGNDGGRLVIHADILPAEEHLITERYPTATHKLGYVASLKQNEQLAGDVETLTRAKYKLPPHRAQALAAFIQTQLKEEVETKVDGDMLVVTASSDDQARIGQFIQLLKTTPERRAAPEERFDAPDDGRTSSDPFGSATGVTADRTAPQTETAVPKAPEENGAPR